MTDQKPTGVFVPLHEGQLREDQIAKICNPKRTMTENLLAIGTPIQDSVSIAAYLVNDADGTRAVLYTLRTEDVFPCVLQKHHHAAVASLQAEVLRLREALASRKRENFNAGYLLACCNIVNMHNEEGIASDILAQAGITEAEVKALDLSEYDANALVEIRKASSEDPILKGGAV